MGKLEFEPTSYIGFVQTPNLLTPSKNTPSKSLCTHTNIPFHAKHPITNAVYFIKN
jgi:hypothetical protein